MSDVSQGPGWWQASDGMWYPPKDADKAPAVGRAFGAGDLTGVDKPGDSAATIQVEKFPNVPEVQEVRGDRWMQLMDRALEEADLPPEVAPPLREFLDGVATFMINRE